MISYDLRYCDELIIISMNVNSNKNSGQYFSVLASVGSKIKK